MKTTRYFLATRERPDRATIRNEWIEQVLNHPEREVIQADGRIKTLGENRRRRRALRGSLFARGIA